MQVARGIVRPAFGFMAVAWLSCSTDKIPCTDSGEAWLDLPQSRVTAVARIRTEGVCEAIKPEGACDTRSCVSGQDGQQRRIVPVRGLAHGTCKVTVEFSDDCPAETLNYKFGGAIDDCCADVCFRPTQESYAIGACASTQ